MNATVTRAKNGDYQEIINHAIRAFDGVNFPYFMSKIYKNRPEKSANHYIVRDKGSIVGAVLFNPSVLRAAGVELSVCGVGTVSVDSLYRKSGFMKSIFAAAENELNNCDLAVLHGQRQRYEHFGFSLSGAAAELIIAAENLRAVDSAVITMSEVRESDTELLDTLYTMHQAKCCRADRPRVDFFDTMFTYGSKPFAYYRNGRLIGYMCVAKNKKLIYEICLSCEAPASVKQTLAFFGFESITVRVPLYEEYARELGLYSENCSIKHCCNIKINNYPKVIEAFLKVKAGYEKLDDGIKNIIIDGVPIKIEVKNNEVAVGGEITDEAFIFCKQEADMLLLSHAGLFCNPAGLNWFPLPLFFPDLDNV